MKNKYLKVFTLSVFMLFASCISSKVEVPYSATRREIVQLAQTEFNNGMYHRALDYYAVLLQRYGNDNAVYVEGRYEIAHIYIKQKKYSQAKPMLEEVVELYNSMPPGSLPGAFKKLAQNDLAKIPG